MARRGLTTRQLEKTGVDIGLEGLPEVLDNIGARMDFMLGMEAKKVWMGAALIFVREIRDFVNSRTGKLASAIFAAYGRKEKPNVVVGVSYGGRGKAPHAWLVEHGHAGIHPAPPHPFFRPGVMAGRPLAGAYLIEGMHKLALTPLPLKKPPA